ncbi:MAG: Ycf51 family protein [Verrucomicrobia bacterium]|nr:Ycf51 family protein [Leptolyngbya sp. ES-bin-22]
MFGLSLVTIAIWSGYFTLLCAALMLLGLVSKWGIRFRLVGITGFMSVLTGGLFALGLGLHDRPQIPGAVKFVRVFDSGASQVVIVVPPTITETQLDATLRQAAVDLYSTGRLSQGDATMTIRARAVLHPEPGVSQPVYLGQIKPSLASPTDQPIVELDREQLARLPQPSA